MSELNYLEKLLDGTEVEWKALGDVTSVLRGKRLTKNLLSAEEKFPVFHGGLEPLGYYNKSNRPANTVMIINVGASAGTVGYSTVDFWSSDGCFCLEHNELLNNRFLYFALIGYQSLLKSKVRVAGIPTLDAIVVNKLLIPIPCPENPEKSLAIQSEIVRILDKFSALTAELTAELNMRKKQYNYYRDQLLSFDEEQEKPVYLEKLLDGVEVEWRTLGEIAVIYDGTHKTPKYTASGVPFVSVQNIKNLYGTNKYISPEDFKTYKNKPRKHDLFMTRIGDVGTCAIVEDDRPLAYYVTLALIRINQQIAVPGFIRYLIESRFGKAELYKRTLIHAVPMKINLGEIGKVAVPIPCPDNPEKSLAIQSEIVRILDKFDTLTNSITEGLPREIELRQKQYEYYRDLLFSFPKPETASN
ncbi:TPA: restriction endonuclease subunit S [Escherichia coli]|nr:restriction endonuclease subunit S [Escherichia coli]EKK2896467.1 restriction endonuclease subunit S [Escherichia coli]MBB7900419.1 restriction endonuclease subunit S [Escherichia coli]HAX2086305.1 restriction endonuclease subunit S [Escherichia coli]HDH7159455.1 restriction endonuclease subunit S [Escherichia coli]